MTETTTAPQGAAKAEPVAQPEQNVSGSGTETKATESSQTESSTASEKPAEPKRVPWFIDRIQRQGDKIAAKDREIEALKAIVAAKPAETPAAEHPQMIPGMVPASEVERLADQRAEQREFQRKVSEWDAAGRKEFPDFVDRCNAVANMGASERPEFMRIVAETVDGHKIVAHLADNPEEAVRILSLPAHRMALEIGRLSAVPPKPKPVSAAPEPIKPLGSPAGGKANSLSDDASTSDWMKARQAQIEAKSPRRR